MKRNGTTDKPDATQRLDKAGNRSGATLVETIIAMIILAIGIAGASQLIVMTMKLSGLSKENNTAMQLAVNRVERMDMSDFDDLPTWAVDNLVCDGQGNSAPQGAFRISTEVVYVQTNLAEIVVQVDIRNRITLEFDKKPKLITTYLSNL